MYTPRPGSVVCPPLLLAGLLAWMLLLAPFAGTQPKPSSDDLPLKRVVLFTSGVGFFDRVGEVEGDARVRLAFRTDDVNDLLKSMVVQDFDGGRVGAITYGSQDPLERTLSSFAIDLTEGPSLVRLLQQVVGERLQVEAPSAITGLLVSVEEEAETVVGGVKIEHDLLVLLTVEGLVRIPVDTIRRLKLLNPKLNAELRQALGMLARENVADRRTVTCAFDGEGRRRVRVAYIQEAPVWKTSYRLVLADDGPPLLQGWAMVENTTEEDWDRVQLTLVSGRPISFTMNLYEPIYLKRPAVALETYASLRPNTHGRSLRGKSSDPSESAAFYFGRKPRRAFAGPSGSVPPHVRPSTGAAVTRRASRSSGGGSTPPALDPDQGVESAASGAEVGELFQYAIDAPVTLARQRSAMLPILNARVEGEKLSIFNRTIHAVHPLNGFLLDNISDLHLMQGPITVFDGGAYAGDAKIRDLAAGESRLISYALDLECEVKVKAPKTGTRCIGAKITKGALVLTHKQVRRFVYDLTNASKREKVVLIEHRREDDWKRVSPKHAADTSRHHDRFRVTVAAGGAEALRVDEERVTSRSFVIRRFDEGDVRVCLQRRVVSDAIKAALTEVMRRQREIALVGSELGALQQQVRMVDREHVRIAGVMQHIDRNSELYKRYLAKLTRFEDELDRIKPAILELQKRNAELGQSLEDYIGALDLE